MWLNLPEPVGGSSTSNLIQLVHLAPSLLLSPVKMQSEKAKFVIPSDIQARCCCVYEPEEGSCINC